MTDTFVRIINTEKNWQERLKPKKKTKISIPRGYGREQIEERWKMIINKNTQYKEYIKTIPQDQLAKRRDPKQELLDPDTLERCDIFKDNIENFIGTVKVPVGIAGPVRVNGLHAQGEYFIPLATTEAALVASINRGISCINQAGGVSVAIVQEGISRDPAFVFNNLIEAGTFLAWAAKNFQNFKIAAEKTTRHGKLVDVKYTMEGSTVHMRCVYTTGDAAGQNIVTIATEKILEYVLLNSPVKPKTALIEGGMSGDKKGNIMNLTNVRGKRIVAEITIPKQVVLTTLHATPEDMVEASKVGTKALVMLGTLGLNLHFSNPITAMSIALGQDPACASECHVGLASSSLTKDGDLYITVTLPNIIVGSVGGGTKLPSQRACLELMGLVGNGKANALAEVMAAVLIAGEISLGAAVVSGDFAKAHKILARDTSSQIKDSDPLEEQFEKAQAMLVKLSTPPSREIIMNIYGLYKQATVGDINIGKPSMFSMDLKAKAKYEAWSKKKGLKKEEAMKQYVELVKFLVNEQKKSTQQNT